MVREGKGRDGYYMVGDYFDRDGVRGVVIHRREIDWGHDSSHVTILNLSEEGYAQWASDKNFGSIFKKDIPSKTALRLDIYTRTENPLPAIQKIDNWQAKYPAFAKATHGDWHLPSHYEMEDVFKNLTLINNTLRRVSAKEVNPNQKYWCATNAGAEVAYAIDGQSIREYPKSDSMAVRSVCTLRQVYHSQEAWKEMGLIICQEGLTDDKAIVEERRKAWEEALKASILAASKY